MAKEDTFLRLLQAHAQLKNSMPARREIESLIVSFLRDDFEKIEAGQYVQDVLFPPEEDA